MGSTWLHGRHSPSQRIKSLVTKRPSQTCPKDQKLRRETHVRPDHFWGGSSYLLYFQHPKTFLGKDLGNPLVLLSSHGLIYWNPSWLLSCAGAVSLVFELIIHWSNHGVWGGTTSSGSLFLLWLGGQNFKWTSLDGIHFGSMRIKDVFFFKAVFFSHVFLKDVSFWFFKGFLILRTSRKIGKTTSDNLSHTLVSPHVLLIKLTFIIGGFLVDRRKSGEPSCEIYGIYVVREGFSNGQLLRLVDLENQVPFLPWSSFGHNSWILDREKSWERTVVAATKWTKWWETPFQRLPTKHQLKKKNIFRYHQIYIWFVWPFGIEHVFFDN